MPLHSMIENPSGFYLYNIFNSLFKNEIKKICRDNNSLLIINNKDIVNNLYTVSVDKAQYKYGFSQYVSLRNDLNKQYDILALLINKDYPDDLGSWNFFCFMPFMKQKFNIPLRDMRRYSISIESMYLRVL